MARRFDASATGNVKVSLTLSAAAAEELRRMADESGSSLADVIRRSLALYRFTQELGEEEQLCSRNRATGEITRVAVLS